MNIRFIGSTLVAIAVTWWGMCEAKKLKERVEFLRALLSGLLTAKAEIEFGRYEIGYIFKRINMNNDKGIFKICSGLIKEKGIKAAWETAVNNVCDEGFLKGNDKNVIIQLGKSLGMSDVEGQKNNIDMVVAELKKSISVAEEEDMRLGKVYKGCSVLLGVFIMIILI